jgi:aminomethyltransferase
MVPFAGYEMPVSYPLGVMKEHLHVREQAGLFDVSHMGQALLSVPSGEGDIAALVERLCAGNIKGLKPGRMRYTQLLSDEGGILDDLMVTNIGAMGDRDWMFIVVNGACKASDFQHIDKMIGGDCEMQVLEDQALLALQGPKAAEVLNRLIDGVADMAFMSMKHFPGTDFGDLWISRSGYTGEDGFELSVKAEEAEELASELVAQEEVEMIGLGARDSLRLEAGLCLYGHDIDTGTSPVEANLVWSMGKRRREEGDFPGSARIMSELADGASRYLVGIKPEGRAPAREGTLIFSPDGEELGVITSGGYGPSVGGPIAMGYVLAEQARAGHKLELDVRGKRLPAQVVELPFTPHRYYRKAKSSS